jgi:hypothetical protein
MARHLGDVSPREFQEVLDALGDWLTVRNVAGSIAKDYSLYRALEDEWERARLARTFVDDRPSPH